MKAKDLNDKSNCDVFKQDKTYPPDETSGWDIDFWRTENARSNPF